MQLDRSGTNNRTNSEDRATQPMEAGGWVSQFDNQIKYWIEKEGPIRARRALGNLFLWTNMFFFLNFFTQIHGHKYLRCSEESMHSTGLRPLVPNLFKQRKVLYTSPTRISSHPTQSTYISSNLIHTSLGSKFWGAAAYSSDEKSRNEVTADVCLRLSDTGWFFSLALP